MNISLIQYYLLQSILFFVLLIPQTHSKKVNITEWAISHNITISKKITLSSEEYFTANSLILEGETIMSIPSEIIITMDNIKSKLGKIMKKIWHQLQSEKSDLLDSPFLKEQSFLTLLFEHSMRHGKGGKFFQIYKGYLTYLEQYSKATQYSSYLTEDELSLIQDTIIGKDIISSRMYTHKEELYYMNTLHLQIDTDDFLKYRALIDSRIMHINNKTMIIPLSDLFKRLPEDFSPNAFYNYIPDTKNNSNTSNWNRIEIKAKARIDPGKEILLQCSSLSNSMYFHYYGFTLENNKIQGPTNMNAFHKKLRKKIEKEVQWNSSNEYLDISNEYFYQEIEYIYIKYFGNIHPVKLYELIVSNLEFYIEDYDAITEAKWQKTIINDITRDNIKRVWNEEKALFKKRFDYFKTKLESWNKIENYKSNDL